MATVPAFSVVFTDGTKTQVQMTKIDLIRLERIEQVSTQKIEFGLDYMYKLAWLGLQRMRDEHVAPHVDLVDLQRVDLMRKVDDFVEIADIEDAELEQAGKASDPDLTPGISQP